MKIRFSIFLLLLCLTACQAAPTQSPTSTSTDLDVPGVTPTALLIPTPTNSETSVPGEGTLAPFELFFTPAFPDDPTATRVTWEPQPYAGPAYALPLDLDQITNPEVLAGLTPEQLAFLSQNGFVVMHSQEEQFLQIRESVAYYQGQPYFMTVDSALHALHITFDEMLKSIERESLHFRMTAILSATLDQVMGYIPQVEGTVIEADTQLAAAYLAVALKLFDPQAAIDPQLEPAVSEQLAQIMAAEGRSFSVLFPDFEDDYGAYKPVGHYAGDETLESYFRGMTWLGRVHIKFDEVLLQSSRVPLIVTLALRQASLGGRSASENWANVNELISYLVGPSDDGGPPEYAVLMDRVYGEDHTIMQLADAGLWAQFLHIRDEIPAPQINSTFVVSVVTDLEEESGWRFMGQRFTLDSFIFQNLIADVIEPLPDGQQRKFPSGLDVMAVFGSETALAELDQMGATEFPNYLAQVDMLQASIAAQPEEQWLGRFYDNWLYSFLPVLESKDSSFPAFMQTTAWTYKDLNASLGSWAELKHDTVLYGKMPEFAGGGGPPTSPATPSCVEPNPEAFYRLAYAAGAISERIYKFDLSVEPLFLYAFKDMANSFHTLGDIAAQQLAGESIDSYSVISDCLGGIECRGTASPYSPGGEPDPVPLVAAVSGAEDQVLEVGVGYVDRIYVLVPLEGTLQVAQGGVFSYYEFLQPRADRLTDEQWRENLDAGIAQLPAWAEEFVFAGGQQEYWLHFRVGDVYIVNEAGADLNLREAPTLNGGVVTQLDQGTYITIVDGPVFADGIVWWQIRNEFGDGDGWIAENQEWYERSW